jgi:dihydroxyacetone kinase DhaKLM complex PTS-EIIA-like component DhaM
MKLQQQITTINQILNDLERKVEEMEQQEYMTYDLGKDLQNISFMIDMLREEIEKKEELQ